MRRKVVVVVVVVPCRAAVLFPGSGFEERKHPDEQGDIFIE
jgi:hypothetical protein